MNILEFFLLQFTCILFLTDFMLASKSVENKIQRERLVMSKKELRSSGER